MASHDVYELNTKQNKFSLHTIEQKGMYFHKK